MIYLIRVRYEDVTLLKVGYAKNIKKRLDQYTTENPLFEFLDFREGDRKLEGFLHDLFKEYKFEKGREWFYYDDYIVENFHFGFEESFLIERIKKTIDKVQSFSKKLRLYCEFKEKHQEINFKIDNFQVYLDILGMEKCKELHYKEASLYRELSNLGYFKELNTEEELILCNFLDSEFYSRNFFTDRLKVYCEFRDKYKNNPIIIEGLIHKVVDQRYNRYYNYFGTEGCKANRYQESYLLKDLKDDSKNPLIIEEIYSRFSTNDRLLLKDVKLILKEIYNKLSLSKTPKATDLEDYFEISKTNIRINGEIKKGIKLGKRLINYSKEKKLSDSIYAVFSENEEVTQMTLLSKLEQIYNDFKIDKKASVDDLDEYFEMEKIEVELYDHDYVPGFKLGRRLK